ncbi:MAG: glycosyltransferase family 1 protein [Candidatus Hydrogenedentes bacterium]|nr:glycosyltransferase family 1 protein [Candidatus Hydrogenedentota bacterium]
MLDDLLKYVPNHLHPAYLGLLANIPDHMVRVAVAGESCAATGYLLKKRPGAQVIGAVRRLRLARVAEQLLDAVVRTPEEISTLPEGGLDALLLSSIESSSAEALDWLEQLAPKLRVQGLVYALFGEPAFAEPGTQSIEELERDLVAELGRRGFFVYQRWPLEDPQTPDGTHRGLLIAAVTAAYNPVQHARELLEAARPEAAYHVLEQIPQPYLVNPASRTTVGLARLEVLAEWIRVVQGHDQSNLLTRALSEFYQLSDADPRNPAPGIAMAECWDRAGDPEMAGRMLRTAAHVAPSEVVSRRRECPGAMSGSTANPFATVPAWDGTRPFRVLYLLHPRPHYGLDVLYDGLCACLGDENVIDYPWKATLHGGETPEHRHYPCRFNRLGTGETLQSICDALRQRAFDFILFGDVEGSLPPEEVRDILDARGDCPVFLMDGLDEMGNFRYRVQQRLGLPEFAGYFKREMHRCVAYGPNTWPMPFAYSESLGLRAPVGRRSHDFFWAGHRRFGQRRLYLETLEERYGWNLSTQFEQEAYQARIRDSRIGLNCFGMGFDTVRYWELPAQGCMLLSDRLPIHIPHNFEDGVHAAFFGDLQELVEKVDYYLNRPEEVQAIAEVGRRHFLQYHTNRARAGQLLGRVECVLRERGAW